MPYKDPEEKRRKERERYRRPEEREKRRKRYLERKPELARKREEEAMKRQEACWKEKLIQDGKNYRSHIHNVRRLWFMRRAGKNIDFDPHNAKYVYECENRGRFKKKKKKKGPSAGSLDYY